MKKMPRAFAPQHRRLLPRDCQCSTSRCRIKVLDQFISFEPKTGLFKGEARCQPRCPHPLKVDRSGTSFSFSRQLARRVRRWYRYAGSPPLHWRAGKCAGGQCSNGRRWVDDVDTASLSAEARAKVEEMQPRTWSPSVSTPLWATATCLGGRARRSTRIPRKCGQCGRGTGCSCSACFAAQYDRHPSRQRSDLKSTSGPHTETVRRRRTLLERNLQGLAFDTPAW